MPTPESNPGARSRNRPLAVSPRFVLFTLLGTLCVLACGCRPNKRYDLIEAELRTRDRELAETRAALEQSRNLNRAYEQSQSRGTPGIPPAGSGSPGPPCPVREIVLARGTGGLDDDALPGDETLMVVVVPQDEDRSAVKVPGRLQVAAWEITPAGLKSPIGTWDIPADRLRPTWRSGLIATGYFVTLPWQTFPTTTRVRVAVRLTTTDGQAFETDRDVTVSVVPQAVPRQNPPTPQVPAPPRPAPPPPGGREPLLPDPLPPGTEELPPPAGLSPGRGARLLPPVK